MVLKNSFHAGLCGLLLVASPPIHAGDAPTSTTLRQPARGLNYYDLFVRQLAPGAPASVPASFLTLRTNHVDFVRFAAGGYWPVDWRLYQTNGDEHWRRMDLIVRAAETNRIGLIPSLFWYWITVPDLVGEPGSAWGNTNSRTHRFMRTYTREFVTRYATSPAIWMWEFGNEYNLEADLPNASEHRPPLHPTLGTPATRSDADALTHEAVRTALREFGREVRRHDPHRPISTGNAFPRPAAWHLMHRQGWTRDSESQFEQMLLGDTPDPVNVISVRLYDRDDAQRLAPAMRTSKQSGKALFVGEFGVPGLGNAENREHLQALIQQVQTNAVPFAALWVFDFKGQDGTWNVTPTNDRRWQLQDWLPATPSRLQPSP